MTSSSPRSWFITGCSTGFGRALAETVLRAGHQVAATCRHPGSLDSLAISYPQSCFPFELDLRNRAQIGQVLSRAVGEMGHLDVVVNNAGYGLVGALEEVTPEQIEDNFAVNFFGALDVIRAALPAMRAQKSGHIICFSAAAAISNYAGFSIYGASKFALEGACEALAAEVKPLGIRITLVQPGPFRTDFISRSMESAPIEISDYANTSGKFAQFLKKMDGQQPGDPAKAAAAILRLVDLENPPLRLTLGKYATEKVDRQLKQRQRELENWKELGLPTDFD